MKRIANKDARQYVAQQIEFQGSNMFAKWETHGLYGIGELQHYVVYSYAQHFPMYIYDPVTQAWFGNKDKFSRSTTRQQSQARPGYDIEITWTDTETMQEIRRKGSIVLFRNTLPDE